MKKNNFYLKIFALLLFIFLFAAENGNAITTLEPEDLIIVDTQTRGVEYYIKIPSEIKYKINEITEDLKLSVDFIDCKWADLMGKDEKKINILPVKSAKFLQLLPTVARINFDLYFKCEFEIAPDNKFEDKKFLKMDILLSNKEEKPETEVKSETPVLTQSADTFIQKTEIIEELLYSDMMMSGIYDSVEISDTSPEKYQEEKLETPSQNNKKIEPETILPAEPEQSSPAEPEQSSPAEPEQVTQPATTPEIVTVVKEEIEYVYSEEEVFYPQIGQTPIPSVTIEPPKMPITAISPAKNSIINNLNPEFLWSSLDSTNYYQLYLARYPLSENSVILTKNVGANNYTFDEADAVEPLINKGKYVWFVVAFNDDNEIISLQQANDYSVFEVSITADTIEEEGTKEDTSAVIETDTAVIDTQVVTPPEPEIIEVSISNVKFNDKSVEIYEKNVTVNKDDIENGLFKITGTLTGANGVKTFQFSYDGGSSFNNITFLSQTSPYQFTFTFTPKESVEYKFLIKIIASDDREISDNYFGQIEKVTYINKTANDLIKELLTDFCKSYQTNDKTLFLKCVSESFIGNNEGYEDYTSIESSIRNVFNKTATFICLYQNEKINILSPTRAQVDFVFKRTFKFDDIDRTLPLQINASFDLIKEEDAWKILGDKNNLVFMKHFPDIPSTPY